MMIHLFSLALVLLGTISQSLSQCIEYPDGFNQYRVLKCPLNITNNVPIVLTNIANPVFTPGTGSLDDGNSAQIILGFPIWIYGVAWDRVYVGTNGGLFFGPTGSTLTHLAMPVGNTYGDSLPIIAPLWTDMLTYRTAEPMSNIVWSTQGAVGSRIFVVRWDRQRFFGSSDNAANYVSMDVIFYENRRGYYEIRYHAVRGTSSLMTSGLQSFDDGGSHFLMYRSYTNWTDIRANLEQHQVSYQYIGQSSDEITCGGLGLNFNTLRGGADLSLATDAGTYYINVCGEVQNTACANSVSAEKAMMCFVPTSGTAVDLGIWGPNSHQWQLPPDSSQGVELVQQSGSYCSSIAATVFTTLRFACDATATTPQFSSAVLEATCVYRLVVRTSLACGGVVRDNSTDYPASTLPRQCSRVSGAGYTSNACPRSSNDLAPMALSAPTRILANLGTGTVQVPINFPFNFYGRPYSSVWVSMMGSLWFGGSQTAVPTSFPSLGLTSTTIDNFPAIVPFGVSFSGLTYAGLNSPNISWSNEVINGKRSLVVRYWDMKLTAWRGLYDMVYSFDVILSEGEPGGVSVRYYKVTPNTAVSISIGLHGPNDLDAYAGYVSAEPITATLAYQLQGATLNFTYTGRMQYDACAAFGVNFTDSIAQDLTFTDSTGATYYVNPCGQLRSTTPCRAGTSICQVIGTTGTVLSSFNPAAVTWAHSPLPTLGLRSTFRDGVYCATTASPRVVQIDWLCSRQRTDPFIVSARETSPCVFNIQIMTPRACDSDAVCSTFRNPEYNARLCPQPPTATKLVLTNESQPLMVGIDDASVRVRLPFTFWMYGLQYKNVFIGTNGVLALGLVGQDWAYYRMPVSGTNTDALPIIAPLWTDLNPVDASRITYSNERINGSNAFVVRYSNMEYFGNVLAGTADTVSFDVVMYEGLTGRIEFRYYQLTEGSHNTAIPVVVGIEADDEEQFLAVYNGVNVDAAVASTLSNSTLTMTYRGGDNSVDACAGLGYNLTSLAGRDLVFNSPGQQFTLSVCGTVRDPQCMESSFGDRASLCQEILDANQQTTAIYMVAEYKPKSIYWAYPAGRSTGVMMINQEGAFCAASGSNRILVIDFVCDPTATTPRFTSFTEPQVCTYVANITTSAVCGPGARGTPGVTPPPRNSTLTSCLRYPGQSYEGTLCPRSPSDPYYYPETLVSPQRILDTDDGAIPVTIGFPFSLYGADENNFYISSNGLLSFGYAYSLSPNGGFWPTMGFVTSDAYPMIAAFWTDLINLETTAGWIPYKGYIQLARAGTAPNRRLIIRFWDVDYYTTRNYLSERSASFDVVIIEGGDIEIRFYTIDPAPGQTVLMGMHGFDQEYLPVSNQDPLTVDFAGQLTGSTLRYRYVGKTMFDFCSGIPGGWNISMLAGQDLVLLTPQANYFLRPCGYVSSTVCTSKWATQRSSFCQATPDNATTTSIAIDSAAAAQFQVIDDTTLRMTVASGQMCAAINGPRRAVVDYICNPAQTRSVLEAVWEDTPCVTRARVVSALACPAPPNCRSFGGPMYNARLCADDPSMRPDRMLNPTNPTYIHAACDDCSGQYAIGFPMRIYGQPYNNVYISVNGWIGFGTAAASTLSGTIPSTLATAMPLIAVYWRDLHNRNINGNASISYSLEGTAPNRIFLIRWSWVTYLSYQDRMLWFDVKLYEGSEGRIDVLYHKVTSISDTATIGIQSNDGTSYTVVTNNPTIIDASVYEGKMLRYYYTGSDASVNRTCGGLGYDFTPMMGNDLSLTQGGTTVYVSPCSITRAPACLATSATDRAVVCAVTGSTAASLGIYNPASSVWSYLSNGVQQYMASGPYCAVTDGPGIVFINYFCVPTLVTPRMVNFTLTENNCLSVVSIETSRACGGGWRDRDDYVNSTKPATSTLTSCYTQTGWNMDATICPRSNTDPFYNPVTQTRPVEILRGQDNAIANVQIGFTFHLYGTPYTELNVSSNGLLSFGPGSTIGTQNTFLGSMPASENSWPVIAAFWSDLWNGGSVGEIEYSGFIKYSVEGTAPNRYMIIRFNMLDYYAYRYFPSVTGVSFDVFLYEGTDGKIEVRYYRIDPNPTTYVTVGVRANDVSNLAYTAVQNWQLLTADRTGQLAGSTVTYRYTGSNVTTACGAFGISLGAIRDIDISWTNTAMTPPRTYWHRACGVVQADVCRLAPITEHSTLCEVTGSTALFSATQFNPASVRWTRLDNGIESYQQTGSWCPAINAPRIAVIRYICAATATTPRLTNVALSADGCTYTTTVETSTVCRSSSSSTGPAVPSSTVVPSTAAPSSSPVVPSSSARPSSSSTAPATSSPVIPRSSSSSAVPGASSSSRPASSTAGPSDPASSTAVEIVPESTSNSSLGGGAIAGIVIGVLIGALLICVALFFFCFSSRRDKGSQRLEDEKDVEASTTGEHQNETHETEEEVEMQEV